MKPINISTGPDLVAPLVIATPARRDRSAAARGYGESPQFAEHRLAQALREAIAADRIDVALQPRVQLATCKLTGLEALARWRLSDGRVVPPNIFTPLAESHGLMRGLGERVLERALSVVSHCRERALPHLPMSVNLAASQLADGAIVSWLAAALKRFDLPAEVLELEITESSLLGREVSAAQPLRALRDLGVRLSIDDFGAGCSTMAHLRYLPVHRIKLDRNLVGALVDAPGVRDFVQRVVQFAHRMQLRCVAEGIESAEQLALLREMACDEGQGYLLARPGPPSEVVHWAGGDPPWLSLFSAASSNPAASALVPQHALPK